MLLVIVLPERVPELHRRRGTVGVPFRDTGLRLPRAPSRASRPPSPARRRVRWNEAVRRTDLGSRTREAGRASRARSRHAARRLEGVHTPARLDDPGVSFLLTWENSFIFFLSIFLLNQLSINFPRFLFLPSSWECKFLIFSKLKTQNSKLKTQNSKLSKFTRALTGARCPSRRAPGSAPSSGAGSARARRTRAAYTPSTRSGRAAR